MAFETPARQVDKNDTRIALEKQHDPSVFCINCATAGEMLMYSHALYGVCVMFL